MTTPQAQPSRFGWLVTNFAERVPGVAHAIVVSADGLRLHGRVGCGGTLRVAETADTVTITLHVPAIGPGMRSCALVDVGARLAAPLDGRTVVDAVSGHEVKVLSP